MVAYKQATQSSVHKTLLHISKAASDVCNINIHKKLRSFSFTSLIVVCSDFQRMSAKNSRVVNTKPTSA
jgi:hypothetical protein